ncbi:bifunctional riboflavin kinase/FMN adenylyltransferase [Bifidobacterium avesanii]|uniref:Bifunctional riboflavin kinase/FMN adenylyltransferase n=1 Tax=Bifidobacterium avesanii TaxID=1798157 RepID=A0A7K3TH91_9BIFI|nr:riboflavin kinase [Bifidobacterium avesanii]KAB8294567.1 bifunctional riboflavin kinase/FMN adenylyltransferase [Bifidobacterium avesanii]NEG78079.1 bifunctional riboflavin kinase/FMN adenylyltransferase [Bifidobacterium avesanii]
MKIIRLTPDATGLVAWPTLSAAKKSVVTVGVFDGMHRGHQAVVSRVVELAGKYGALSAVVLFDPRPALVHGWAKAHGGEEPGEGVADADALTDADERIRMMRAMGVDYVLVVRYTLAFAAKSYRFFLGQMVGKLGMRTLVLGQDAAMGAGRAGDVKAIRTLAEGTGVFELDVVDDRGPGYVRVPAVIEPRMPEVHGEPADPLAGLSKAELRAWSKAHNAKLTRVWSSTNVRWLLSQGRVRDAAEVLGHPHAVEGTVVHGEERGRTIGFPTANLGDEIAGYLPVDGVYAGWLVDMGPDDDGDAGELNEQSRLAAGSPWRWPAAISIGTKPTFSEKTGRHERVVEAYAVSDDWLDLYGHRVRVEFVGYLRPQIRFDGADELVAELKRNVEETKRLTAE